jgi:osmotically-inducible protein OsmY
VLDVANDVQVKVPGSLGHTDTEIARAVRSALEWDVLVPDQRIQSTVSDGLVMLEGNVDFWSQREDAERAVRNLSGVRTVLNSIEVKSSKVSQDVRQAITDALERHAEREAKHIDVSFHDGRVAISGAVHSWDEKQAVLGAARGTLGVRQVDDRLRIEY